MASRVPSGVADGCAARVITARVSSTISRRRHNRVQSLPQRSQLLSVEANLQPKAIERPQALDLR